MMVDLPDGNEGLDWVSCHEPAKLVLIPGVQAASITAAAAGHQEALEYLRFTVQQHAIFGRPLQNDASDSLYLAVSANSSNMDRSRWEQQLRTDSHLQQLLRKRMLHSEEASEAAASDGNLAALKWLIALCYFDKSGPSFNDKLMLQAVKRGHLSIMQWMHSGPCSATVRPALCRHAMQHLECLHWIIIHNPDICVPPTFLLEMIKAGALKCLRLLDQRGSLHQVLLDPNVAPACTRAAAREGHLSILQWLRARDPPCPWNETCLAAAAKSPNLEILSWLRAQQPPCPWDDRFTRSAVLADNFGALKWLRAQKPPCPWDIACPAAAALNGNIKVLQWLRNQDPPCPFDACAFAFACTRPTADAAEWLFRNSCPYNATQAYGAAACNGRGAVLQWLHDTNLKPAAPVSADFEKGSGSILVPHLMFLGDIGSQLRPPFNKQLVRARKVYCLFHGLLRWCRKAVADPRKGAHHAFDCLSEDTSGQQVLTRMSMLPPDLIIKIAVMAGLQHDMVVKVSG